MSRSQAAVALIEGSRALNRQTRRCLTPCQLTVLPQMHPFACASVAGQTPPDVIAPKRHGPFKYSMEVRLVRVHSASRQADLP